MEEFRISSKLYKENNYKIKDKVDKLLSLKSFIKQDYKKNNYGSFPGYYLG